MRAHLETLPATARGLAFVESSDAAEEQVLTVPAGIQLTWLHRNGIASGQSPLLAKAVQKATWLAGRVFAWVAAEALATQTVRGLAREQIDSIPYWKAGVDEDLYHDARHEAMDRNETD